MENNEKTKILDRSNIADMPNPKHLTVEQVAVRITQGEGNTENHSQVETGYIRNANLHPSAIAERR